MTDNTMPEQLYITLSDDGFAMRMWAIKPFDRGTTYIRADLVPAVTDDARREALNDLLNMDAMVDSLTGYTIVDFHSKHIDTIRAALQTPSDTALRESHDRLLEALKGAYGVMNYMGDIMNGMNITLPEDETQTTAVFNAVRKTIAEAEKVK